MRFVEEEDQLGLLEVADRRVLGRLGLAREAQREAAARIHLGTAPPDQQELSGVGSNRPNERAGVVLEVAWFWFQGRWLHRLPLHGWLIIAAAAAALLCYLFARTRGIDVANVPDYGTEEVADSAIGQAAWIYEKYKDRGFVMVGVPANNFGVNGTFQVGPVTLQTLAATQKALTQMGASFETDDGYTLPITIEGGATTVGRAVSGLSQPGGKHSQAAR